MEVEVEEERRRREGERGGLNLFYVWTYCAIYQWPDLSNVCLDRSVQYNIGHIWPIGQISPMEAINYNFPDPPTAYRSDGSQFIQKLNKNAIFTDLRN